MLLIPEAGICMNAIGNSAATLSSLVMPKAGREPLSAGAPDDCSCQVAACDSVTLKSAPGSSAALSGAAQDTGVSSSAEKLTAGNPGEPAQAADSRSATVSKPSVPLVIPMEIDGEPSAGTLKKERSVSTAGSLLMNSTASSRTLTNEAGEGESRTFPGASTNWEKIALSRDEISEDFQTAQKFFSQMNRFREEFTSKGGALAPELSMEEKAAVKDYTSGVFEHVNRYLRGNQTSFQKIIRYGSFGRYTKSLEAAARLVTSALNRMPAYEGKDVYRAVHLPDDIVSRYTPGSVVTEHGFTSCSKTMNGVRINRGHTVFVIRSKSARDVQNLSLSGYEEEVLFRPECQFKVLSVEEGRTKLGKARFIYMEEQQ